MRNLRRLATMVALAMPTLLPAQARVNGWAGPGSRIRVAAPALSSAPRYTWWR
jgi:hypothetical protein